MRAVRRALVVAAALCTLSWSAAIPVMAASHAGPAVAARPACANTTETVVLGPPPCSGGTTAAQERYEAILTGAGLVLLGCGAFVYRRKHNVGSGPGSPSQPHPI
jgi:hypothetical protein